MPPNGLTILVPIRRGDEARLRVVLQAIGNDIKGRALADGARPHIHFPRSTNIHFARFAILDDLDRGAERRRLLYSANFDGSLDDHLRELAALTTDMDAIWGACEGYRSRDGFGAFVAAHALPFNAFYIAFRDETVAAIRRRASERRSWLTSGRPLPLEAAADSLAARLVNRVQRLVRAAPIVVDVLHAVLRFGLGNVWWAGRKIVATLGRNAWIAVFNRLTSNALPQRQSHFSSVVLNESAPLAPMAPGDEIPSSAVLLGPTFREDVVTQNQLTLVTVVEPRFRARAGAVLAGIDAYAKRLSPPGSLTGISTIHFVRWMLIDNDRRLVMLSDYDGSWEAYIDEFAEMILSGLDAIWSTSLGFPPDGARDLPAFKRFLRSHQVPSEVFYSAYPEETVLTIAADRGRWGDRLPRGDQSGGEGR
jgi:hypothetical protein